LHPTSPPTPRPTSPPTPHPASPRMSPPTYRPSYGERPTTSPYPTPSSAEPTTRGPTTLKPTRQPNPPHPELPTYRPTPLNRVSVPTGLCALWVRNECPCGPNLARCVQTVAKYRCGGSAEYDKAPRYYIQEVRRIIRRLYCP
jgi:hypothetical protein